MRSRPAGWVRSGALLALALLPAACGPSANTLQITAEGYISAVSLGDVHRILEISAPFQREKQATPPGEELQALERKYRGMIEGAYMLWDQAKATGELPPGPLGITLIRGIGLGKEGAAAFPVGYRFEDDGVTAILTTRAITNYSTIPWDRLPSGGRMYLMGIPFGKVVNFATGYDDPSQFQLLATVDLEWTLVKLPDVERPAGAPSDWYVERIEPLPETATSWTPPSPGSQ